HRIGYYFNHPVLGWLDTIGHAVVIEQPTPPLFAHGPNLDSDPRKDLSAQISARPQHRSLIAPLHHAALSASVLTAVGIVTQATPSSQARPRTGLRRRPDAPCCSQQRLSTLLLSTNLNPNRAPFTFHPSAPPPVTSSASRASTSTTISRNQSQSQRSTIPAKRTIDLLTLEKPIHIVPGNNSAKKLLELLPPDVHGVHKTFAIYQWTGHAMHSRTGARGGNWMEDM
ncbi:uncharacterized protein PgNI_11646, partial [Pyricularia grisea]|uniref:Uncharacterized protein n=1 Tax=Pyricularia grisea TaxID=148305 RepID=A0A6P8ANK2_PYRGI